MHFIHLSNHHEHEMARRWSVWLALRLHETVRPRPNYLHDPEQERKTDHVERRTDEYNTFLY